MTNWIQTKAGLQMVETINKILPKIATSLKSNDRESSRCIKLNYEDIKKLRRDFLKMIDEMDNHNDKMEEIEERLYSGNETMVEYLQKITVCLEEIAKIYTFKGLDAKAGIQKELT
tara:strand:- start:87 stop:434 length:348 start_codon:yes stop_codon:yes gene_type:complete